MQLLLNSRKKHFPRAFIATASAERLVWLTSVSECRAGSDLTGADEFLTVLVPVDGPALAWVTAAAADIELLPCLGAPEILPAHTKPEGRLGVLSLAG